MKETRAAQHEGSPRPVIGIGNEYAAGTRHPAHSHRRAQLLYAEYGTMLVEAGNARWVVPPHEGVWIPAGTLHGFRMLSDVGTRSVYFAPEIVARASGNCEVVGVSPLLRQLLIEAADLPADYDPAGRGGKIMSLVVDEVGRAPVRPLAVPMPRHRALLALCRRSVAAPSVAERVEDWSGALAMSRRTFTRLFRQQTGLSFAEWQRRACLHAAIARLLGGERVTSIALDLGYSSPAAFTAMFTKRIGCAPGGYKRDAGELPA